LKEGPSYTVGKFDEIAFEYDEIATALL
jgi:hypothetical protein